MCANNLSTLLMKILKTDDLACRKGSPVCAKKFAVCQKFASLHSFRWISTSTEPFFDIFDSKCRLGCGLTTDQLLCRNSQSLRFDMQEKVRVCAKKFAVCQCQKVASLLF